MKWRKMDKTKQLKKQIVIFFGVLEVGQVQMQPNNQIFDKF